MKSSSLRGQQSEGREDAIERGARGGEREKGREKKRGFGAERKGVALG